MKNHDTQEAERLASSRRSGERLRAMDMISIKAGGRVVRMLNDARVVPLLLRGLADVDRKVQRAAARGLRPWIDEDPELLDSVLRVYAGDSFDGRYSHAGLYDTQTSMIWIPRFAAVSGHAALLPDANVDRYFRFDFFVAGQAPGWIPDRSGSSHLIIYLVPEWSYARQKLTSANEDRAIKINRREQELYAKDVIAFYRRAALPYAVRVHVVSGGGGYRRSREIDVERIEALPRST